MVWRLLLTLAVLGTLLSLGDCQEAECSDDSGCEKCQTCDAGSCVAKACTTISGQACNPATDNCEKTCTRKSDCVSTRCDTCGRTGFCQTCPSDLQCITYYQDSSPPECLCVVNSCETKCGKGQACCSADSKTCNCCPNDATQTCYASKGKRDQSSSWARDVLHMEKNSLLSKTCQKICTKDPKACDSTKCEKCRPAATDADPTRKVCAPCDALAHCNNDIGEKACCTGCGCVCCDPWETCKDKSCQCDVNACEYVECGKCDPVSNLCLPNGKCDPGLTCRVAGVGKGTICECTTASCSPLCGGTCDATTGLCTPGDCSSSGPDQACKANPEEAGSYSCQCDEAKCDNEKSGLCSSPQDSCCLSGVCDCYEGCPPSKKNGNTTGIIAANERLHNQWRPAIAPL